MSENIWDCEYFLRCQNNTKCLMCGMNQRLLKLPEDKNRANNAGKIRMNAVTKKSDNSGTTLEDYVTDSFNNVPTVKEYQARRQLGSGNIWFMPGDVADSVVLAECKERGTVTSKGEKTISIPKAMLEKIEREAKMSRTYPALPFRYKGDESGKTYVINDFDVLVEMVHEIKLLRSDNESLRQERDLYKKKVTKEFKKDTKKRK